MIQCVPDKYLYTADNLSRWPLKSTDTNSEMEYLAELAATATVAHLPVNSE